MYRPHGSTKYLPVPEHKGRPVHLRRCFLVNQCVIICTYIFFSFFFFPQEREIGWRLGENGPTRKKILTLLKSAERERDHAYQYGMGIGTMQGSLVEGPLLDSKRGYFAVHMDTFADWVCYLAYKEPALD